MGPNYSVEYVYDTYEDADDARNRLLQEAEWFEFLSLNDVNAILDKDAPFMDPEVGWTEELIMESRFEKRPLGYSICLPKPININKNNKEDKTMATTTNKTLTPEELELEKAIKEVQDEAEKKITDIRIELSKKIEAIRTEYQEQEAIRREEHQARYWKRRYDALLKEGFSVEQAWEMTMKSFEVD